MDDENLKSEKIKELINLGAEIAGGVTGGAVGLAIAGPVGAVAVGPIGAILTSKIVEVVGEFALRNYSRREKMRAGAGLLFAYTKITHYLDEGRTPRRDDFFKEDASGRSSSDEILEGVLLKCRNEHQEKKLRYLGNIYANCAFDENILPEGANSLMKIAENLTYRQLCLLALIYNKHQRGSRIIPSYGPIDPDATYQIELEQILHMIRVMENEREIFPTPITLKNGQYFFGLTRIGGFCYKVMNLDEIPEEDIRQILGRWFPRELPLG